MALLLLLSTFMITYPFPDLHAGCAIDALLDDQPDFFTQRHFSGKKDILDLGRDHDRTLLSTANTPRYS